MTIQNIFIYTRFLHYDYYIVLTFLVEFYIIPPSTLILPSCVHNYHVDLWWQTNFGQNWMYPFRKQNVTTALNMTTFKYMHLIIGKIIRTLNYSTEYIKLISPHFPLYTFLWDYMNFKPYFLNNIYPPFHDYWNPFYLNALSLHKVH